MQSERETHEPTPHGTTLKELIPFAEKGYGGSGPHVSPRVIWLSEAMEGEEFWSSLNSHMVKDESKRHSVGGIFTGPSGETPIGPFTWSQVFYSLDRFMKEFDQRATEFIFRDFSPNRQSPQVNQIIEATRTLALNKYPRLRRIFWDDYQQSLESPVFWRSLADDLDRLPETMSTSGFFYRSLPTEGNSEPRLLPTHLQANTVLSAIRPNGISGRKAKFLDYPNFAQMIRDTFGQNPREFLLNYNPQTKSGIVQKEATAAKSLLSEKILPPKPHPETLFAIRQKELEETLRTPEFWLQFVQDLDSHSFSPTQAYSLNYFLRAYDRDSNNIVPNNFGDYAHLSTPFFKIKNGSVFRQLEKPTEQLAMLLMWKFQPKEDVAELVLDAKRLCAELFQQDCLYVALETPEFWEDIAEDIKTVEGNPSFVAFLRFYSGENRKADGRAHKKGSARYQRFMQRAYHKSYEFDKLCAELGVDVGGDYSESLSNFFYHFAPLNVKELFEEKFPQDFREEGKAAKLEDKQLLEQLNDFVSGLMNDRSFVGVINCKDDSEVERIRNKLTGVSRNLNVHLKTSLDGTTLTLRIASRKKFNSNEIRELEPTIKDLRDKGLQNKEIAQQLGLEDYIIEYMVGRLIRRGELQRRR